MVSLERFGAERFSTPSWWRSARFSRPRAARLRNSVDTVARVVERNLNIEQETCRKSSIFSDSSAFAGATIGYVRG